MKKLKTVLNTQMEESFEAFSENDDGHFWVLVNYSNSLEKNGGLLFKFKRDDSECLKVLDKIKKEEGAVVQIGND